MWNCGAVARPALVVLQQLDDAIGQPLLAEDHREVGLPGDLLQDLELLQLHQRRAGLENRRGVGLHPHGGRLLTTRDERGLRGLLRLRHLVHQLPHVAWQDDVADTRAHHRDAELRGPRTDTIRQLARERLLSGQQRIQVLRADRLTQRELRGAVERLGRAVDLHHRPQGVGDAIGDERIHTQSDLVVGHDVLPTDVERLLLHVYVVDLQPAGALPEGVRARVERGLVRAIAEPDGHVTRLDLYNLERAAYGRRLDDRRQLGMDELHRARVDHLHPDDAPPSPALVQPPRQKSRETAVDPDEGTLVVLEVDHHSLPGQLAGLDDDVELFVHEPRVTRRHDLQSQLEQRIEVPVHTRAQHGHKVAFTEEQTALVRLDFHSLDHRYLLCSFLGVHPTLQSMEGCSSVVSG